MPFERKSKLLEVKWVAEKLAGDSEIQKSKHRLKAKIIMISQFFVLSQRGDNIVFRDCEFLTLYFIYFVISISQFQNLAFHCDAIYLEFSDLRYLEWIQAPFFFQIIQMSYPTWLFFSFLVNSDPAIFSLFSMCVVNISETIAPWIS